MSGVVIADEMGLGKTVQALAVLHATGHLPAVVVCPTSLKLNWCREATRWLPGRTAQTLDGTRPYATSADVLVVGYDVLHAWVDALPAPRALILDEAHFAKNGQARRTKATIALADRCRADGGFVIALTGTPVLNRPAELVPQLRAIGRLDEFGGAQGFRRDYSAAPSLPVLNRRLRASCFVRRHKRDVLTELPPKRWATVVVPGDPAVMREYRDAEANIVSFLAERARAFAEESGLTDDDQRRAYWQAAMRAQAAQHLVAMGTLRQIAARAKAGAVRDWIREFAATEKKLVLFAWHRATLTTAADEFADGCRIMGQMSDADKQAAVDRFQTDDTQRVIACSLKAAGVGITLTAASDVLFVEQAWTPGDMDQAADRCHRIGQHDSVTAWNMLCEGTVDEDMADLIANKRTVVDAVTDGAAGDASAAGSVLGDLVVRLAERGLARA